MFNYGFIFYKVWVNWLVLLVSALPKIWISVCRKGPIIKDVRVRKEGGRGLAQKQAEEGRLRDSSTKDQFKMRTKEGPEIPKFLLTSFMDDPQANEIRYQVSGRARASPA